MKKLSALRREMLARVIEAGTAGYFHNEVPGEAWRERRFALKTLLRAGLVRTRHTAENPPRLLWLPTFEGLRRRCRAALRSVFIAGNAGYPHDEAADSMWDALVALQATGIVRSSRTREAPPRLRWHLTPEGAQRCRALWCPEELAQASAPRPCAAPDARTAEGREGYAQALGRAQMAVARSVALREAQYG